MKAKGLVGGVFTINAVQAGQTARKLNSRIIIPMDYKTVQCRFPLAKVEDFTSRMPLVRVFKGSELEVRKETLPQNPEIIILQSAL